MIKHLFFFDIEKQYDCLEIFEKKENFFFFAMINDHTIIHQTIINL